MAARTDAARRAILKGQAPPDIPPKLEKPNIELNALLLEAFVKQYLLERFDAGVATPDLHREMWELCCSDNKYVAIAAPRGHAKSTSITLAYVLASCLFRQKDFVIIVSDTWGQSVEFLRDLKTELLENEGIIKDFETRKALKDSEDDIIFQMRDGHKFRIVARGSEQKVRGLKWNNKRPNLIACHEHGTPIYDYALNKWMPLEEHPTALHWDADCLRFTVALSEDDEHNEVVSDDHFYLIRDTLQSDPIWVRAKDIKVGNFIGDVYDDGVQKRIHAQVAGSQQRAIDSGEQASERDLSCETQRKDQYQTCSMESGQSRERQGFETQALLGKQRALRREVSEILAGQTGSKK